MSACTNVDCVAGRELGCQTYCCRLLVRLDPDERARGDGTQTPKGYVNKAEDGYCINFDRKTHFCKIWHERPRACRAYSCNGELLLQVAIRHEFKNVVELVKLAATVYIPEETFVTIPLLAV
jgi:hypothetical protein